MKKAVIGLALAASLGAVSQAALAAAPTNAEQLWLELINRFRASPVAELDRLTNYVTPASGTVFASPRSNDPSVAIALEFFNTSAATLRSQFILLTPAQPVAWNSSLHGVALAHGNLVIANDQQLDQFAGEASLLTRYINAGYGPLLAAGQNLYAFAQSTVHGHAGFAIDWGPNPNGSGIQSPPGHRDNLLNPLYREVGVAVVADSNPATQVGPLVVNQNFGARSGAAFLSGVAFTDLLVGDAFYTVGEGIGGLAVNVWNSARTGVVASTTTFGSGGYGVQLAAGLYDVQFVGGGYDFFVDDYTFGTLNRKLDFVPAISAPIPEPETYAMLLAGLGLLGFAARSRRGRKYLMRGIHA